MRSLLALLALLAALALAATATAAAPSRCHLGKGERLVAHSTLAVVSSSKRRGRVEGCLRRTGTRGQRYRPSDTTQRPTCRAHAGVRVLAATREAAVLQARDGRVLGCSKATGRRRLLWPLDDGDARFREFAVRAMAGTRVVAVVWRGGSHGEAQSALQLFDAVTRRRAVTLGQGTDVTAFPVAALRRDGTVAWIAQDTAAERVLRLRTPAGAVRTLDRGSVLAAPRLRGKRVDWLHDAEPRSALLAPPDACLPRFASGTQELGIDGTTFCLRATGREVSAPAGTIQRTAGSWAAVVNREGITRIDAATGLVETIPMAWVVLDSVLDDQGHLAWTAWYSATADGLMELWVRDGAGARRIMSGTFIGGLRLDGLALSWLHDFQPEPEHFQLTP